jgi:transcriptional regulator with XRE-family HTH domain
MPLSFKKLRAGLCITQDELASYLGVTRGLVAQLESGQKYESAALAEKLGLLSASIKRAGKKPKASSLPEFKAQQKDAQQWLAQQRKFAADRAALLAYQLSEMREAYNTASLAVHTMQGILADPETDAEVKNWLKYLLPKVQNKAQKNNPKAQAKMLISLWEALGIAEKE